MSYQTIAPAEALAAAESGRGILLDVRTPGEFREVHALGAILIPLDVLSRQRVEAALGSNPGPVHLLCASGIRAVKAAAQLQSAGLDNLRVIEGGTQAWSAAGLPVLRGRKTLSIERQVRIGAGLLVLTGVSLGWFLHPGFFILAAFVGAGLVFAGVSDICGLAIFLALAPWNRSGKEFRSDPP